MDSRLPISIDSSKLGLQYSLFQTGSVPQEELITAEQEAHTTQSASSVPYDEARLERENGQSAPDLA